MTACQSEKQGNFQRCERANAMWIEICMTWLSAGNIPGDLFFCFAALFSIVKLSLDGHRDFVRNSSKCMYWLKDDHRLDSATKRFPKARSSDPGEQFEILLEQDGFHQLWIFSREIYNYSFYAGKRQLLRRYSLMCSLDTHRARIFVQWSSWLWARHEDLKPFQASFQKSWW